MSKSELFLKAPFMNAAGCLGFAPDAHGPMELSRMGAFITNPVSLSARSPANGPRFLSFPGGFLLHTGYPNPGLNSAIRRYASRWKRSPLPVLVHLLAQSAGEIAEMVRKLEGLEGVAGFEIGFPTEADAEQVRDFAHAAEGELAVLLRVPLDRAASLADGLRRARFGAVSLAPPRGALPLPEGGLMQGRLYGPALFPQALAAVQALARGGIPVIGAGGVYSAAQAEAMLQAGAIAVQLDAALWRGGWLS
jgi:dihydroorotate dehydrogenase (NAD+) catalytic subunit